MNADIQSSKVFHCMRMPLTATEILIKRWQEIESEYPETSLGAHLMGLLFEALDLSFHQVKHDHNISKTTASGLKPDYLVYKDIHTPPILVIEIKKRIAVLANTPETDFAEACANHNLYKEAVGYEKCNGNGIKQYLDVTLVKPERLASYGLVFNGDFFQIWRRVDGLVFPLTPIQKFTATTIPKLVDQLAYCLNNPHEAFVGTIWNKKGGVSKTTNTICVGATLALAGKRVLLIDLDQQSDLTASVGLPRDTTTNHIQKCLEKIIQKDFDEAKALIDSAIRPCSFPASDGRTYTLFVLPGSEKVLEKLADNIKSLSQPLTVLLPALLSLLRKDFDYVFLDIAPTADIFTRSTLYACDGILISADLGKKSLHHAAKLYNETIPAIRTTRAEKSRRIHSGPWNLGIAFSNCPADTGSIVLNLVEKELKAKGFAGKQYKTQLRTYAQMKVAEFKHVPVISWQNSPITKLYQKFVDELFLSHNFVDH